MFPRHQVSNKLIFHDSLLVDINPLNCPTPTFGGFRDIWVATGNMTWVSSQSAVVQRLISGYTNVLDMLDCCSSVLFLFNPFSLCH